MAKKSKHSEQGGTGAILALQKAGITPVIHTYEHDERAQAWGLEAAQALGLDPARVFKTLLVSHEKALAVVVIPVASRLDLKAPNSWGGRKRSWLIQTWPSAPPAMWWAAFRRWARKRLYLR